MSSKILFSIAFISLFALGCNEEKKADSAQAPSSEPAGAKPADVKPAAATEVSCTAVVDKLMGTQEKPGEAEKKMYGKMCEAMPPAARACIVAASSKETIGACMADKKAF